MIDYIIRQATTSDIGLIFECINDAYRIERDDPVIGFKNTDRFMDITDFKKQFKSEQYLCYQDSKSNQIYGVVFYKITHNEGYIGPLAVFPRYQNKGVGSALIRHVEQEFLSQSIKQISMRVVSTRIDLFPYYEKRGYQIIDKSIKPETIGLTKEKLTKNVTVYRLRKIIA